MDIRFWKRKPYLSGLENNVAMQEELLGILFSEPPTHDKIRLDASRIANYSTKEDYKIWAKEAWSHILSHLDSILDKKSSQDQVNFHRGALSATLDLLRISYQARNVKKELEEAMPDVSSVRQSDDKFVASRR